MKRYLLLIALCGCVICLGVAAQVLRMESATVKANTADEPLSDLDVVVNSDASCNGNPACY
jgi:hypothetical protein